MIGDKQCDPWRYTPSRIPSPYISELPTKPHDIALVDAFEETAHIDNSSIGVKSNRFWFSESSNALSVTADPEEQRNSLSLATKK